MSLSPTLLSTKPVGLGAENPSSSQTLAVFFCVPPQLVEQKPHSWPWCFGLALDQVPCEANLVTTHNHCF
ncbi:hypothetical protein H6P81_010185 [Aristolochia fimbriata]|uniref:Uncharacterized protein n=1 Tax=Aristolochia fimbriata TaxID=158543 RepID=A0AAV7EQ69_ARIFI|nr:hypothetical protein H6P81_010185 [Aristolochia fimbriata]